MGNKNIETKVKENKAFFDAEPSSAHFDNFREKLNAFNESKPIKKSLFLTPKLIFAIAASVGILLLIPVFKLLESSDFLSQPPLSEELIHVKMYYSQQTESKLAEIEKCKDNDNSAILIESATNRMQKLEESTLELEQKLSRAHGNKQMENAYIQSLRAKSDLVNQVYEQLCADNTNLILTQ
ncbi:MAG: hypothetical protein V1783_01515 [Bacteroidota bacterium]